MKKFTILAIILSASMLFACSVPAAGGDDFGAGQSGDALKTEDTGDSASEKEKVDYVLHDATTTLTVTEYGSSYVYAIAEVENTGNVDLYLSDAGFDLEDSNGKLLALYSVVSVSPSMIHPGEKAYIYGYDVVDDTSITYVAVPTIKAAKSKIECVRLPISDDSISEDTFGTVEIVGRVENTTDESQSLVKVSAIFFDADGKAIAGSYTYPDEIQPGGKQTFSINTMDVTIDMPLSSIGHYELFAEPFSIQW